MNVLGIDIGGSGMKGGIVNTITGEMLTERYRIPTPKSKKPADMAKVFHDIVAHFNYSGPVGVGFPSIIKHGVCMAPGNLHKSWVGTNAQTLFTNACGLPVKVINDADAAGYAVINYGIGKGKQGLVLIITIGTGLGSGAFFNGELLPNFELGQIPYKKYKKIETYASNTAKEINNLSFKRWGKRFNNFLQLVETITCPDVIILGGGSAKDFDKYQKQIKIQTPVIPAELGNYAGIIGAAAAALHEAPKY
ncbi:ROK family protein [Seonamhaeicola algicola]|uniref:ROK family protein n=1 Tax=Seonamhaeicola algicola TaxID=1719036 RepID=A0A5C7ATZ5_9FLAO|nr:ROK family protein [Seonamhaeicola algicola]TXE11851.1 ROK family protein [Seonamhaeicola algicola]